MFVIFGQRNFGKVDRVPGAFYVVTQFFHVSFLPLIPLTTYVVLEGTEGGNTFKGKQIGMSFKSILTAWSRFALIIGLAITAVIGFITFLGGMGEGNMEMILTGLVMGFVSVMCGVVFWLTYRMSHASEDRAMQLADELGLSRAFILKCIDPNRSAADLPELEPAGTGDRDYDRRDRDYDRERDYDRSERDRGRDRERDYDRPDPDYDRRDY
jgi:hypothetical protein